MFHELSLTNHQQKTQPQPQTNVCCATCAGHSGVSIKQDLALGSQAPPKKHILFECNRKWHAEPKPDDKTVCPKLCLPRPVMCVGDLWPTMPHIACILSGPSPKSLCCTTYAVHAWCVWQARPDLGKPGPTQDTHKISMHVLMACSTPASPTHIHGEIVCSRTFHQGRNTQDLGQPGTQEEIENDHWQVLQFATPPQGLISKLYLGEFLTKNF